jgi:hypothetical protein
MRVTGEYVDWDSTDVIFRGIFGAQFTLRGDASVTTSTAPNGRFILCVPAADGIIDIAPMGSEYVAGSLVVNKAVIQSGAMLSLRSFKTSRAVDFGFTDTQAHVYVHVDGGSRTATTTASTGVRKTFDGAMWVDGNTGADIYLGNVEPQAMTTLTVPNTSKGAGSIPLTAGAFTYVNVVAK